MADIPRLDYRASLRPKVGSTKDVLGGDDENNIMQPLYRTGGGVLFPFTPIVSGAGASANYDDYQFTHSIYKQNVYRNSLPNTITVTGEFIAQSTEEAKYLLAVLYFLRSATKAYFGEKTAVGEGTNTTGKSGLPPPVLHFNYLGSQLFNNLPVVIKTFVYELPNDVDYVPVIRNKDDITYVPTKTSITIELDVQQNPNRVKKDFDLDEFKQGKLLKEGFI